MTDVHALSGAYAIDALDDLERAQFERHLADCADCRAEVASLQEASALVGETSAVTPPPQLRERVLASIGTVRPLPPVVTELHHDQRDGHRRRRFQGLVAAAAAVTVLGAGAAVWQPWADETSQQELSATERIMQAADAEVYTKRLGDGAKATVVRSKSLNEAVITADNMPEAPDGYAYALWLQHDDVMVFAGIMPKDDSDTDTVLFSGDAATANGAGITVEMADEEPQEPSNAVVATFAFKQA